MAEKEQLSEALERLERDIDKEIAKLKYYMEPADELIENNDYLVMEIAVKQGTQIISKITDLISQLEGLKLDFELRRETFDSGRRTRRTSFLPLYKKGTKFPNYYRPNKDKGTRKSRSRIGRPNGSARSASREIDNKKRNFGRRSSEPSCAWQSKSWRWKWPRRLLTQSFVS